MTTPDIYNLDATALFYARPVLDRSKLISFLHEQLGGDANRHMQVSPLSQDDWWLLACKDFHIMISFADQHCDDQALRTAASSPVTSLQRFDYLQAVQSHKTHIKVEIGDGHAPLPPEARVIMQEFGGVNSCDPALKMRALQLGMQFISIHEGYLALFFGPSERLFSPEEFGEILHANTPIALLIHPVPTMPEIGPSGLEGYHLRLKNPGHLGGSAMELEGIPTAIPLATAVSLLSTLLGARAKGKVNLHHGKVFKPSQKVSLYVRETHGDETAPNGRIILSFWSTMGHDVPMPARPVTPTQTANENPASDRDAIQAKPVSAPTEQPQRTQRRAPEPPRKPDIVPEIISVDPEEAHKYAKYMTRDEAKASQIAVSAAPPSEGAYVPPQNDMADVPPAWQVPQKSLMGKLRSACFAMALGFGLFFVPFDQVYSVLLDSFQINQVDLAGSPASSTTDLSTDPVN